MQDRPQLAGCFLNLSVTFSGLGRLGLPAATLERFPQAFRETPRQRAAQLGDTGSSAPEHWDDGLGTGQVHLLVALSARTAAELTAARAGLRPLLDAGDGLRIVCEQPAGLMAGKREHFGYADGFAQPEIEGVPRRTTSRTPPSGGGGVPRGGGGWRPLKLGEFVRGIPTRTAR